MFYLLLVRVHVAVEECQGKNPSRSGRIHASVVFVALVVFELFVISSNPKSSGIKWMDKTMTEHIIWCCMCHGMCRANTHNTHVELPLTTSTNKSKEELKLYYINWSDMISDQFTNGLNQTRHNVEPASGTWTDIMESKAVCTLWDLNPSLTRLSNCQTVEQ